MIPRHARITYPEPGEHLLERPGKGEALARVRWCLNPGSQQFTVDARARELSREFPARK